VGVGLHDVLQDWPPTDLDQRLGPELGFFAQSRAEAAAQDHMAFAQIDSVRDPFVVRARVPREN